MTPKEEHENSPTRVPLAPLAKRDGKQHSMNHVQSNRGTDKQDMLKSDKDCQVSTRGSQRLCCPTGHKSKRKYKISEQSSCTDSSILTLPTMPFVETWPT
ncbi:hypothetical protein ACFX2J_012790 [Malus domestica]